MNSVTPATKPLTPSSIKEESLSPTVEKQKWLDSANQVPTHRREAYKAEIEKVFCFASQVLQSMPATTSGIQALASSHAASILKMQQTAKEIFNSYKDFNDNEVAALQRRQNLRTILRTTTLPSATFPLVPRSNPERDMTLGKKYLFNKTPNTTSPQVVGDGIKAVSIKPPEKPKAGFLDRLVIQGQIAVTSASAAVLNTAEKIIGLPMQPEGLYPMALKICENSETVRYIAQSINNAVSKAARQYNKFSNARTVISENCSQRMSEYYDIPLDTTRQYNNDRTHLSMALTTDTAFSFFGMAAKPIIAVTKRGFGATLKPPKPAVSEVLQPKVTRPNFTLEEQLIWGKNWVDHDMVEHAFSQKKAWVSAYSDIPCSQLPTVQYYKQSADKIVALVTYSDSLGGGPKSFVVKSMPRIYSETLYDEMLGFRFWNSLGLKHFDSSTVKALGTFGDTAFFVKNVMPGLSLQEMAAFTGEMPLYSLARTQGVNELTQAGKQFAKGMSELHSKHPVGPHPLTREEVWFHRATFDDIHLDTVAALRNVDPTLSLTNAFLPLIIRNFERKPGSMTYGLHDISLGNLVKNEVTQNIAIIDGELITSRLVSAQREIAIASNNFMVEGIPLGMTYQEIRNVQDAFLKTYRQLSSLYEPAADRFFDYQCRAQTIGWLAEDISAGAKIDRAILGRLIRDLNQPQSILEAASLARYRFKTFVKGIFNNFSITNVVKEAVPPKH